MKANGSPTAQRAAVAAMLGIVAAIASGTVDTGRRGSQAPPRSRPKIEIIDPPEEGFFSKSLSSNGILIKAPGVVVDDALFIAYDRISQETEHLPMVVSNLAAAGAQLHIIGRDQVTTDLPEWGQDKHVSLDEYNGLTRDQRTRGMGGLITSCGEENLLGLSNDRYRGRDICMHEFAHNLEGAGIQRSVRAMFDEQYQISKSKGLWLQSYAGSNPNEYFAELTMWYFGTHGDLNMTGTKPENGPEGLKKYDPDAYKLFDDFYQGRIEVEKVEPRFRPGEFAAVRPTPHDSLLARAVVARLSSFKVGETKLAEFFAAAGMTGAADAGTNGWHVTQVEAPGSEAGADSSTGANDRHQFRVFFRNPVNIGGQQGSPGSGASQPAQATHTESPRPRAGSDRLLADLEFKGDALVSFNWDN